MTAARSHRGRRVALVGTVAITALTSIAATGTSSASAAPVHVIVQTTGGDDVAGALTRLGAHVDRSLPIISGYAVTIAGDRLGDLSRLPGVLVVTPDDSVKPMSTGTTTTGTGTADTGSLSAISQIVGAQSMWDAGYAGQGIDIAVIDTGIARVPGLDAPGKVIDGPDLSFDPHDATVGGVDAFGHGTHMAGIIAGSDVPSAIAAKRTGCTTCLGASPYTDTTKFVGIAPQARLVNVKVGAFDGAADVSQVIAAIDWVVQHAHDPGYNIRVLNLSFGTDSTQSALLDPLAQAADAAWRKGIVVVAAAGNEGRTSRTLADPAIAPSIIAVGSSDPKGTLATNDDSIPSFAQHGDATRGVDFVAPGVSVTSLRVPGSFVDQNTTTGRVGDRFQRGSGTSQSTAVVSGLAALLLSKYPEATPDTVKASLKAWSSPVNLLDPALVDGATASAELSPLLALVTQKIADINRWYSGSGTATVAPAVTGPVVIGLPNLSVPSGLGTLEASRGTYHVVAADGTALQGEVDIMGQRWTATKMAKSTSSGTTWRGGIWNGARWSGDSWAGARWSSVEWTSNDWSGARWSGARWSDMTWNGARWSGARWSGARWSSGTWSGARWSGARWSDFGWQ